MALILRIIYVSSFLQAFKEVNSVIAENKLILAPSYVGFII